MVFPACGPAVVRVVNDKLSCIKHFITVYVSKLLPAKIEKMTKELNY
jgi:hypothetical protein